jgi:hypothetical protein
MATPVQSMRDKYTFSVVSLFEADDDRQYWRSKSAHERLQAIELMRQVIYGYSSPASGLQRFFEVAELATG